MTGSKFVLMLGVASAIGMFGWGLSGVLTGRILDKSYGRAADGSRRFSRYIKRSEEPVWFWVLCGTYMTLGIALLVAVALFFFRRDGS
jgi:hypothetical protein